MPPIQQQQSSRGGLIASLVVSIVLAITFLVMLIMSNAELTKSTQSLETQKKKYEQVIPEASLGTIGQLKGEFNPDAEKPTRTGNLIDMAAEQRKALVKLINGVQDGTEKQAVDAVAAAFAAIKANPALKGAAIPTDSLTGAINALTARATTDSDAVAKAKADAANAAKALAAAMEAQKAELAKRDQAVAEAQAAMTKSGADAKAAIDDKQKQVDEFSAKVAATEKQVTDAAAEYQVKIQTLEQSLIKAQKDYAIALSRLAPYRANVKESIVRNVDATITQVSADSICYINLGYGDHVVTGLTFEIYGKRDGVPKLADGTSALDMPKGKGSIEIINVGQNSCQCRILTVAAGQTIEQGDLCVNVVYDKNIKPVFYVFGKFDMDQNGVASDPEAEIVKNLITRWGGKVADKINIDTDFVVLGKEPVVPLYTADELNTPLNKQKSEEAKAALAVYMQMRDDAVSLHIPVMNQNRFLYYTGYFEASKK
jgi:hypothetical protein